MKIGGNEEGPSSCSSCGIVALATSSTAICHACMTMGRKKRRGPYSEVECWSRLFPIFHVRSQWPSYHCLHVFYIDKSFNLILSVLHHQMWLFVSFSWLIQSSVAKRSEVSCLVLHNYLLVHCFTIFINFFEKEIFENCSGLHDDQTFNRNINSLISFQILQHHKLPNGRWWYISHLCGCCSVLPVCIFSFCS